MTVKFLAAALVLSCALGPTRPRLDQRVVWDVAQYQDIRAWERSPWFRIGDISLETPIFLIISTDGMACRVDAPEWVLAIPNELYHCASGWIYPRLR